MIDSIAHIVEHSSHLDPIPTDLAPDLPRLTDIRAVAFDIYGTLFISGSGDIGMTDAEQESSLLAPLLKELSATNIAEKPGRRFRELIEESHREARAAGIEFPEVDILEIWRTLLRECGGTDAPTEQLKHAATVYEVATNPVWPMPGALETTAAIRDSGRLLGIVSNAQFYTPLLFQAFWKNTVQGLGFDPGLCFYSYRAKQAKPGRALYENLHAQLADRGIRPEQTLYVGNDMLKDVHPAASLGFRTALFAGDQRSLRLRSEHSGLHQPDAVITALPQLLEIIG